MPEDPEYVGSATLIILGDALDPSKVSSALRLRPNQAWRKGDTRTLTTRTHKYRWGGWKKFCPDAQREKPLERQLLYWCQLLKDRASALEELAGAGNQCLLDCFITTAETASIIFPVELQRHISSLNLELHMSFFVHSAEELPANQAFKPTWPKSRPSGLT